MQLRKTLLSFLLIIAMPLTVFASQYKVSVKGNSIDTTIKTKNSRTMIGLRDIGEALGLQVDYDKASNKVSLSAKISHMENVLVINLNTGLADATIWGDGDIYHYERSNIKLEVPPKFYGGRVYVPLRFVCDVFASPVDVNGKNIIIGDLFSSGVATHQLGPMTSKVLGDDLERYGRDLNKILDVHSVILGYMEEITSYRYNDTGTKANELYLGIVGVSSELATIKMQTKAGQKMQQTYRDILSNLGKRSNNLSKGNGPSKASVEALEKLVEMLYEDFGRVNKMVD